MRRDLIACLACWALVAPIHSQETKPPTPEEQFRAIAHEYDQAREAFARSLLGAQSKDERQKILARSPDPQKYASRMLDLTEKNPKATGTTEALIWVIQNAPNSPQLGQRALARLLREHLDSKQMGLVCQILPLWWPDTSRSLRTILQQSPHHEVQGHACLKLAQKLRDQSEIASDPARRGRLISEAERLFERIVQKYSDVKDGDASLADLARSELFEIRSLVIGKEAPDIEGEDADGNKLRLRDYRGKIVVLIFWAEPSRFSMAMVPKARSLIKRQAGKPFIVLGINFDLSKELLRRAEEKHQIPWPSWFDGRGGRIGRQWNIRVLPTLYVLDAKGIIRYKGVDATTIEETVDRLIKALEKKSS